MAGTYYKYAERNVESQINWAEVGKNLTDMLSEEAKVREQKKAAIDEATRKFGETLANSPQGEHAGMNQWALDYAADAQEARLIQDRLLRSGQLKLRDYNIMRQNITDGTKGAFDLFKEYQEEYKVKMERAKSMDPNTASQYLEQWEMEQAEGFSNFTKSKLYINPTNGQVSVGKMVYNEEKGVMELSTNPNNFVTINQMRNRLKSRYDKYNVDANATQWAKGLAKFQREIRTAGGVKKITDASLRKEFDAAFDGMLKAQLEGNPYNTTSILTDYLGSDDNGQQYTFTYDEADAAANPNKVLLKPDPTNPGGSYIPDFSTANGKKQYEAAKEYMKNQTIVKLERLEDFQYGPQMQQWQYEMGENKKKQENMANMLGKLYSGTNAEVQNAMDYFKNLPGVVGINRTADGVSLSMRDKDGVITTKDVSFRTPKVGDVPGELVGAEGFIQAGSSLFLGASADPKIAAKTALATKGKSFNEAYTGTGSATISTPGQVDVGKVAAIDGAIIEDDATGTADNLNQIFSGTGISFSFNEDTSMFGTTDEIIIKDKAGNQLGTFAVDDKNNLDAIKATVYGELQKITKSAVPNPAPSPRGTQPSGGTQAAGGVDYSKK